MNILIYGKELEVKPGIKIDRVITKTSLNSELTCIKDSYLYDYRQNGDYGSLKTNIGKILNNGVNLGSSPKEAEMQILNICDGLQIIKIDHNIVEYCIDLIVPFKLRNHPHIVNTFSKMLGLQKFNSSIVSYINDGSKNTIQEQLKGNIKGVKGKKSRRAFKIYSKLDEKGWAEESKNDIIRVELILYSQALEKYNIHDLRDVDKVKKEIKKYIQSWEDLQPKRINRYTKNTQTVIKMLKKNIDL